MMETAERDQTIADDQRQIDALTARVERLRAVAEAADLASLEIDRDIRSLEPRVNTMQEAAAALSTLVQLTGSVQQKLVGALNQLAPGDRDVAAGQ